MIRVAHVVHGFDTGGLEHGIVKVLNGLPPERWRHAIVSLTRVGALAAKVRAPGTRFVALGKRPGNDAGLVLRLAAALRALRPHVIRTYGWPTWLEGILAARLSRVRAHVHSEHGRYFYQTPAQRARRRRAQPIFAAATDAVLAVSGDIARDLRATGVAARRVHVIRNGVDTEVFRPPAGPEERAAARAALGIAPGTLAIGSVGRLVPEKDYPGLVRAVARASSERTSVHNCLAVLIAGEGPERPAIEAAARETGLGERVRLLGERDDIPSLHRALDLFVLPSVSEGLSNTLIEAAASGLPIVATRVGGNAEVVADGESALIVPPSDPAALASALAAVASDPALAARLGAAARARAVAEFSLARMAERHGALIERFARLRNPALARAAN